LEHSHIVEVIDKLRNKEVEEYLIKKEVFLSFREVLVKQNDFKHFRGIAQQGGDVIYTFMDEPRS
jgi:hypothetical protein